MIDFGYSNTKVADQRNSATQKRNQLNPNKKEKKKLSKPHEWSTFNHV